MAKTKILVYGAYGYTGELIVRLAKERGVAIVLGGRNQARLDDQAKNSSFEVRAFALDDVGAATAVLADVAVVIHCAGPFAHTYKAMADLCLNTGTHYTDITGEAEVFEGLAGLDAAALQAKIMVMPGTGFDVVPSDCLANHVKARLPDATHLELAFRAVGGGLSHGTATTMAENIHRGGMARIDGKLVSVPTAWKSRAIPFRQDRTSKATTIPWGDVVTAWHSTGIPNIWVYTEMPQAAALVLKLTRPIHGLLGMAAMQKLIKSRIDALPAGPSDAQRAKAHSELWAEARNAAGQSVQSRLQTLDGYTLTAESALAIAQKIAAGNFKPGFQTPAMAYGKDLILEFGNSAFEDL